MPNWCDNHVRIEGPVDKIYNMAKACKEENLLEYMVPVEGTKMDRINAWGTKWDISEPQIEHIVEDGVIDMYFMSAWGPPSEAFLTYMDNNEDVDIQWCYQEGGNCFLGVNGSDYEVPQDLESPRWEMEDIKKCDETFGIRDSIRAWEDDGHTGTDDDQI